jgi:diguanylate cyclase
MMARRMVPSPDNYRTIYNEIAGITGNPAEVLVAREFKSLLLLLPRETAAQQGLARQVEQALKNRDWESCRKLLADFIREHSGASGPAWGELIAEFLQQWEARQSGFTQTRKRESFDRVLSASGRNSDLLFGRLQNLIRIWAANEAGGGDITLAATAVAPASPGAAPGLPVSRSSELLAELRETFVFTLETIVAAQLEDEPELAAKIRAFAAATRAATTLKAIQALLADIKRFAFSFEFVVEDRAELRAGLLRLLQLMIDNIGELVIDDRWMSGQIGVVREIVAQPANLRLIRDAEQRLTDICFKLGQVKLSLMEAKDAFKQMLTGFVDHLADFAESTSDYHDKIGHCLEKISQADDITQLENVLGETIREMRVIQLNAQRCC